MHVHWYQGKIKEVAAIAQDCLWLAGKESAVITLKAVRVRSREGDEVILMSTCISLDIASIIEGYVKRSSIEVTSRECRDYLGVKTQRQWSDLAIERTTPLLFALYAIITLIGNAVYQEKGIVANSTACYAKKYLTFSDLLEGVRNEIGEVGNIKNSLLRAEFENNPMISIIQLMHQWQHDNRFL